jgi:biotin carboxyl carrier protein
VASSKTFLLRSEVIVKEGHIIAIIEAMKMEIQIRSPSTGRIKKIKPCKDQSIKTGDIIVTFE